MVEKTKLVLTGKSKAEIAAGIQAALTAGGIPPLGPDGMCFMMSKAGNLNDKAGHWHPHLMFFTHEAPAVWGANLPGSPVLAITDDLDHVTTFLVPIHQWSDGSADEHAH